MKHRIVEVTKGNGFKEYRCERTGLFRKNHWRTMVLHDPDAYDAIFPTLEQAREVLRAHLVKDVIRERVIEYADDTFTELINNQEETARYYIRFGEIPENEVSGIYRGECKVGEEKGVSVYDAIKIDGEWRIVLPHPLLKEIGFDLYNFISDTKSMVETKTRPMYLVQGDEVGKGSTNEPLLRNIKIIKEL